MGIFSPGGITNVNASNQDLLVDSPAITNSTTAAAGTELAIALPAGTKRFLLRARGNAKLQIAYTTGQTNTVFFTVMPGARYNEVNIDPTASVIIYLESNKASTVVELVSWS